jgi:hypothetical protein
VAQIQGFPRIVRARCCVAEFLGGFSSSAPCSNGMNRCRVAELEAAISRMLIELNKNCFIGGSRNQVATLL